MQSLVLRARQLAVAAALLIAPLALAGAQVPQGTAATAGRVVGKVTDASGRPVANAQVSIDGTRLGTSTNANGEFTIGSVPAGTHAVSVRLLGLCGVIDRVRLAPANGAEAPRVHYHYVIIDYAAAIEAGTPRAGSDAAEVRWVPIADLGAYDTTDGLADMIHRAASLCRPPTLSHGG